MKKKIWKHFPSNLSDWIEYTNHILTFVFLKDCMMSSRLCSSLSKREIWPSITWSCSATPIYKNNKKQTINKQIHTSNNSGTGVSCRWKFFFCRFPKFIFGAPYGRARGENWSWRQSWGSSIRRQVADDDYCDFSSCSAENYHLRGVRWAGYDDASVHVWLWWRVLSRIGNDGLCDLWDVKLYNSNIILCSLYYDQI